VKAVERTRHSELQALSFSALNEESQHAILEEYMLAFSQRRNPRYESFLHVSFKWCEGTFGALRVGAQWAARYQPRITIGFS
jgi:hypothetical protein